ncbi:hypothetical protein TNCV_4103111 [Trichonephila clavipes]|nr:hypothetical protein TNCV_4103111 [Trichonephila clavipes]
MSFYFIKNLIKRSLEARAQKDLYNRVFQKSWRNAILNWRNGPWRRVVAEFRLATGHDCLRNRPYRRLKVVPFSIYTMFSNRVLMSSTHLLHCPALYKTFLAERY